MFDDAQPQVERILALVNLCPDKLQEKCFDILLSAYVASLSPARSSTKLAHGAPGAEHQADVKREQAAAFQAPDSIRARLVSTAGRIKVSPEQLASLFDFSTDLFSYHAYVVPGTSKKEQTRNVALMLAAKSYLSGAGWTADWKEFRASCVDQNCYDKANNPSTMRHAWFRLASPGEGITLSSAGTAAAEALLAKMAGAGIE